MNIQVSTKDSEKKTQYEDPFFSLRQNVEQLTSSSGPARAIIADIRRPPDVRYGQKFRQPYGPLETGTIQPSVTQMFKQGQIFILHWYAHIHSNLGKFQR